MEVFFSIFPYAAKVACSALFTHLPHTAVSDSFHQEENTLY